MHLIEKENGILEYVADKNETAENQRFIAEIAKYKLVRHGAGIYFFSKEDERLILYSNPFDNSLFVCDPSGYALAAEFGAKRFPVGKARTQMLEAKTNEVKATQFERDLSFPLQAMQDEKATPGIKVATLQELLILNKKNEKKVYEDLSELFNRCANFTPGKQQEYLEGGQVADKFCRANLESQQSHSSIVTDQIFLLNKSNKVIGTISATVMVHRGGAINVYFYDEVVDYTTLLNPQEKAELQRLYKNDEKLSEVEQRDAIAKIIEPKRLELMAPLFAAARKKVTQTIRELSGLSIDALDQQIKEGMVHAFVRAADGRVPTYRELGCGEKKPDTYVIHGPPTGPANMLVSHVKSWANQQLERLSKSAVVAEQPAARNSYLSYGKVFSYGVALAALGVIAVKLWNRGSGDALSASLGEPQPPVFGPGKK